MRILVVEDERSLCDAIVRSLRRLAYSVDCCHDGRDAMDFLAVERFDLVVLDLNLPGADGMTVLRTLREVDRETKVLILSARSEVAEKVAGLDAGANDYLTKPFGVMELVSCVKAVLRRVQPKAVEHLLKTGGLFVNLDEHTVSADGARVELTYKEFELLKLFLSHPGVAWTREKLMEQVWGTDYCGETRTVDMHIRTLRQKLGSYGDRIETVRGVGYRWEAQT